jgi:serine protease Do
LGSWQLGSGVLISADGKVLTNQHVVEPSLGLILPDFCLLMFSSDFDVKTQKYTKEYRATIVGFFQNRDAALLKIKDMIYKDQNGAIQSAPISGSFQYFQSATSSPQIGDAVYIIGYPESAKFAYSVTKGIISNLTSDGVYFGTDAQIDRGNSGGAAINSNGQLVGLPTYKYAGGGDYRGYILDINSLKL